MGLQPLGWWLPSRRRDGGAKSPSVPEHAEYGLHNPYARHRSEGRPCRLRGGLPCFFQSLRGSALGLPLQPESTFTSAYSLSSSWPAWLNYFFWCNQPCRPCSLDPLCHCVTRILLWPSLRPGWFV